MEQKIVIGMGTGEFIRTTVSRETCHVCGKDTRIFTNYIDDNMSYVCGNPKCGEDK